MDYKERLKQVIIELNIIKQGSIFYTDKELTNFGNENRPKHYAVCFSNSSSRVSYFGVNLCTSKNQTNYLSSFQFHLNNDSSARSLALEDNRITNILFGVSRSICIYSLTYPTLISHVGFMNPDITTNYLKARKQYINSKHRVVQY